MPKASADQPSNPRPSASQKPSPDDHLKTLIEFLKPGSADLVRRWVAALMLAPESERERIVEAVEGRIVELYALGDESAEDARAGPLFHVADEPVEREGRVEQTIRTYAQAAEESLEQGKAEEQQAQQQDGQRRKAAE